MKTNIWKIEPEHYLYHTLILSVPAHPRQSVPFSLWAGVSPQYPYLEHQYKQLPLLSTLCSPDLHLHDEGHAKVTENTLNQIFGI